MMMNIFRRKLIIGILLLALLSPLGLILPLLFHSREPFGEASVDKIRKELAYAPKGMKKKENSWKAPLKDYTIGKEDKPLWERSLHYIGSGLAGLGIIALVFIRLNKIYKHNE